AVAAAIGTHPEVPRTADSRGDAE
ncbi:MAG: hypothetical protein QOC68_4182, partial [Solirubrobacteraceae bacterium]|nr:hypothetical protein [Solirubrobacteraceae bacterium]